MRRPERVLRFAWDPSAAPDGGAVEPPIGEAASGWTKGQRPAAQYLNALLNNHGSWLDFLRGPSLSRWTRVALPSTFITTSPVIAADRESVEGATTVRRLVAAGTDVTGLCVHVSHRGESWTRRDNFPVGTAGSFTRAYHHTGYWYLLLSEGATGSMLSSPSDQATGSALDGSPDWTRDVITDGGPRAMAFHDYAGGYEQVTVTSTDLLESSYSLPGPQSGAVMTIGGTAPVAAYTDVVWTGTTFLAVTANGEVVTGEALAWVGSATRITSGTGLYWRLTVGAEGEVIAWVGLSASEAALYRSTDDGASWSQITPATTGLLYLTDLVYADGAWVATSAQAPYLWSSNDLLLWTRAALPCDGTSGVIVYGAVHSEGAWVALRADAVLNGDRAEDLAPGAWTVDPAPTVLGNAGWLRGTKISLAAPADGEVLTYDAGLDEYVPATPAVTAAYTVRTKTTTYTALAGDVLLCDATGGAFTVTLPAAATVSGQSISVKKTDVSANAVTVDGNGAETIDGATTLALATQYTAVTMWSDGANWWVF